MNRARRSFLCAAAFALLLIAPGPAEAAVPAPGQIDQVFLPAPGTDNTINVVVPQPDGKIIAAGRFSTANGVARNRIARFNSNGSLDGSFDPGTGPDGEIFAAVLQPDGRVVIAGSFTMFNGVPRNRVARLNANGSVDSTFGFTNGINNTPASLALQDDGRIVVGGQFSQVDLVQRFNLARLNTDGTVDLTFDPGNGPNGTVNAIAIQRDGRIVIGGTFIGYNGFARGGIARVLSNGSLDLTFDSGTGTGGSVFALALQLNGQIVLGGRFVQYSGINRTFIARVNADGSLDAGFNPIPNDWIQTLALQANGGILLGGFFTNINGTGRNRIARLNADGSLDFTFDPGAGFAGSLTNDATQIRSLALQRSDRIVAGGAFTTYNNVSRDNITRIFGGTPALQNISARAHVFTGDPVLIGGFIIEGADSKTVLIRGIGPSLSSFGISMPLANPILELHDHTGALIASNDNWKDTQESQIAATGLSPSNDLESALLVTLSPGAYTAVVQGVAMTTGPGLVEIFDLDQNANAELTNLSARAFAGTGDDVLIGGIIIRGRADSSARILVRATGPSLAGSGVSGSLSDPKLSLFDANGSVIASNDNWRDTQESEIAATGLAPGDNRESAIIMLLSPGNYTAIVTGKGGTTGIALVEFFDLF
ncbi:MAG TPA: delta-60 repeat domain-containing protein [Chthoniobacterales bacterium]